MYYITDALISRMSLTIKKPIVKPIIKEQTTEDVKQIPSSKKHDS